MGGFAHKGLLLTASVLLTGCSTILTRIGYDEWTGPRMYSGTYADALGIARVDVFQLGERQEGFVGFFVLDLPLSFVADTVLLPLTIYEQLTDERGEEPPAAEGESAKPAVL